MAATATKITTDLKPDDPVQLDSEYRMDREDRRYLDNQIIGTQSQVCDLSMQGYVATWARLDSASAPVQPGDGLCTTGNAAPVLTLTKVQTGLLVVSGGFAGMAVTAASPGGWVRFALWGVLPPTITGLTGSPAGFALLNQATGRAYVADIYTPNDIPIGKVDSNQYLTLSPIPVSTGGGDKWGLPVASGTLHTSGSYAPMLSYDLSVFPANTIKVARYEVTGILSTDTTQIYAAAEKCVITNRGASAWRRVSNMDNTYDWEARDTAIGSGTEAQFDVGISEAHTIKVIGLSGATAVDWVGKLFIRDP